MTVTSIAAASPRSIRVDWAITDETDPKEMRNSGCNALVNIRVVNGTNGTIRFAQGGSTVDAAEDTRAMDVLAGTERVFEFNADSTHADLVAVEESTTGTASAQLINGV